MGVRDGELVIHAGGRAVLIQPGAATNSPFRGMRLQINDDGRRAVIRCGTNYTSSMELELDRKRARLLFSRIDPTDWSFWCQGQPTRNEREVKWQNGTTLIIRQGRFLAWSPQGYRTTLSVGNGLLPLKDPAKGCFPMATISPDTAGTSVVEIRFRK